MDSRKIVAGLPIPPAPRGTAVGYLLVVGSMAVTTGVLWLAQPVLSLGSVYLVYLVVVVAVAATQGWWPSVLAVALAFLAANFFFTPPILTWTIAAPQDILALAIFLALATGTSQLMVRLRFAAEEARRHERATATLYQLSRTINQQQDLARLIAAVEAQLTQVFDLRACRVALNGSSAPSLPPPEPRAADSAEASETTSLALIGGAATLGHLLLLPRSPCPFTAEEERLLAAFAENLGTAIQRAHLQEAATQAEVLRRTDALRAALLSAVSHDLRTPLATIKTVASSLRSPRLTWSERERQEMLAKISAQVDHIARLIGDLLVMGRIEAGKLRPQKELAAITDIVQRVLERLEPQLAAHPVTMAVADSLPLVPVDVVEIDEVLSNLLENAVNYTPPGTPIRLSARQTGALIAIQVSDEGPGIAPEHLPHLFDRYYRVHTGATGGTGLGLAISKGLVEAHGGQMTVVSRPGAGATFVFTLPLAPPPPEAVAAPAAQPAATEVPQ